MAGYILKGSYSTVQVLSPTLVNPVQYCTIQTTPSNVLASMPVEQAVFDAGGTGPELTAFADGIETIMARDPVTSAVGSQTLDPSGLLADNVVFTVEYVPQGTGTSSITAEATVPVGLLNQSDPAIAQVALAEADAMITAVYDNLKNAATG